MPQQDYARRAKPKFQKGRGQSSARRKTQAKQHSNSSGKALWVALGILVIGAFSYGIWKLAQSKPEPAAPPVSIEALPQTVDDDPLPPKPQEEWSYIKELENKEVVVEVPNKPKTPSRPYQMQCGSFRSMPQADEFKAKLAFQGFESTVRRTEGKNGVWFRVVLGPYESRRAADNDNNRLKKGGIYGCQIWHW